MRKLYYSFSKTITSSFSYVISHTKYLFEINDDIWLPICLYKINCSNEGIKES